MSPEFRAGERETHIHLECVECGGEAEGNVSFSDGSGEICDKCDREDQMPPTVRYGEESS